MDNFSNTPGRRQVQDISAVNSFLTKMYSLMILAVLVSAATAFLTTTVFASAIANMLSLIHISEPTRPRFGSRMPSSA